MKGADLRRSFLYLLIGSVAISAVFGIGVVLFGDFGEFEVRVLMTTLTVAVTSILGLACGACIEAGRGRKLPLAGIVLSILAAAALLLIIWNALDDNETFIKSTLTLVTLAVACSHLSLLRLARLDRKFQWSYSVAFGCDWLLAAIILYLMWLEPQGDSDLVFRVMAVLSIVIAAVTVVTPVFHKLSNTERSVDQIDEEITELEERIAKLKDERSRLKNVNDGE
ncbi:MAG: hypothetical protein QUS14_13210 [Pyrinomonadaceae bacterium]|nr:hypothetical protein [Pyrinomonadaceae bacterium]